MDSRTPERPPSPDATEFVRYCYRRRKVGWPELYDEMCAVANRGLYRGWGVDDLATAGIGFSLFEMPSLAALVARVVAEEHERRVLARALALESATVVADPPPAVAIASAVQPGADIDVRIDRPTEPTVEVVTPLRFAGATA
jgi:hypothetical protein